MIHCERSFKLAFWKRKKKRRRRRKKNFRNRIELVGTGELREDFALISHVGNIQRNIIFAKFLQNTGCWEGDSLWIHI